jgi:hypothetical protein
MSSVRAKAKTKVRISRNIKFRDRFRLGLVLKLG